MRIPPVMLQPGQQLHGFRVVGATPVASVYAVVYQLEHVASGARILHVHCDDDENVFSISFPTPPPDNSGMPHILEHSVLAGSRKFPVKEPFFEMIRMSMATFINAMTGYDCTYYPVSSNVRQDLFNLADVYFDAVFHPLLEETTFEREAHHLAPADPEQPLGDLRIDGIVYSEMKGVFSDPESILGRHCIRKLLPETCYGRESGGDPEAIPDLTYRQLRDFHAAFYQPGNAYFCLYGNIPTADYLAFLAPRLEGMRPAPAHPPLDRQPRWRNVRVLVDTYPVGADETLDEKTFLLMNWIVGTTTDPAEAAQLRILSLLLLGNEAAPLRKAIVDSRLGGNLVMSGDGEAGAEATFHVGIKGSEPERLEAFRDLVLATLREVAAKPIDRGLLEAAFQQASYQYLEILPLFPLHTVFRVVSAWIYGADPLTFLRMREHLSALAAASAADDRLFNRLITERLVDNPHRLDIVLKPDPAWQTAANDALTRRMAAARAGKSEEELHRIADRAAELDRLGGRANSPEEVARLPQLKVADLPPEPRHIPTAVETVGGATVLVNDVFSNGVVYLQLAFDLNGLPADVWPWLPRYTDALSKLGAAGMDYAAIARRTSASTGGIQSALALDTAAADAGRFLPSLRITLKTLADRVAPAMDLLADLIFGIDPRDAERLRDVLIQARTQVRTGLVQNGHATVRHHAGRGLSRSGDLNERLRGLPQLALMEQLVTTFDRSGDETMRRIETVRDFLLNRRRVTASLTGPAPACDVVRERLSAWLGNMRDEPVAAADTGFRPFERPPLEGLAAPLQVAHCAMVMPAPHLSHPDEPLLDLGTHLVEMDYMLPEIRFKGNAYGAGFGHSPLSATLTLSSYRDPRIVPTLEVFRGVVDYVREAVWSQQDIDRGIIGVAKHDEKPIRPGEATGLALHRHLIGDTPERRTARRRRLLQATPDEVRRALLETLEANLSSAAVCVMAGRERLEEANRSLAGQLLIEDVLR